ncbi:MAG: hypothetical protein KIS94_09795 [Chitinophagales bacterium]|nr:hypothetical protein [Chitinophagales bacterium]
MSEVQCILHFRFFRMAQSRFLWFVFPMLLLASCSYFGKRSKPTGNDVIARANNEYLYLSDVSSALRGLHGQDSIDAIKTYAQTWVRKKLLLQKAQENISDDDVAIARKIEEYREALILFEYEKALIDQKLDTAMRATELNTWYEKVKNDFPLEEDYFKIVFIKLPKDAPDLKEVKKWITKPKDEEELQKLEGYCRDMALSYVLGNGVWFNKEMALKSFPFNEYEISSLVYSAAFKEYKTDDALWFVKIVTKAAKGEASPLELVRDKIARIIIEKRKMLLLEKTYSKIFEDGKESKSFEIYVQ